MLDVFHQLFTYIVQFTVYCYCMQEMDSCSSVCMLLHLVPEGRDRTQQKNPSVNAYSCDPLERNLFHSIILTNAINVWTIFSFSCDISHVDAKGYSVVWIQAKVQSYVWFCCCALRTQLISEQKIFQCNFCGECFNHGECT